MALPSPKIPVKAKRIANKKKNGRHRKKRNTSQKQFTKWGFKKGQNAS